MNNTEYRLVEILEDLKENHHIVGVKAEFETEGTRFEEAVRLKEIVSKAGLELVIKIGGCGALKDMYEAMDIGADIIVAPMIETAYALKKYVKSVKIAAPDCEQNDVKFFINIETITGFNNLDEILSVEEAKYISGIVFGRDDMCGSLNLSPENVNSDKILYYAKEIAKKCKIYQKKFVVGGGIFGNSIPFIEQLFAEYLSGFETRKIIFNSSAINDVNINAALKKAIDFEIMWLQNKKNFYKNISDEDIKRILILENRNKELTENFGGING